MKFKVHFIRIYSPVSHQIENEVYSLDRLNMKWSLFSRQSIIHFCGNLHNSTFNYVFHDREEMMGEIFWVFLWFNTNLMLWKTQGVCIVRPWNEILPWYLKWTFCKLHLLPKLSSLVSPCWIWSVVNSMRLVPSGSWYYSSLESEESEEVSCHS